MPVPGARPGHATGAFHGGRSGGSLHRSSSSTHLTPSSGSTPILPLTTHHAPPLPPQLHVSHSCPSGASTSAVLIFSSSSSYLPLWRRNNILCLLSMVAVTLLLTQFRDPTRGKHRRWGPQSSLPSMWFPPLSSSPFGSDAHSSAPGSPTDARAAGQKDAEPPPPSALGATQSAEGAAQMPAKRSVLESTGSSNVSSSTVGAAEMVVGGGEGTLGMRRVRVAGRSPLVVVTAVPTNVDKTVLEALAKQACIFSWSWGFPMVLKQTAPPSALPPWGRIPGSTKAAAILEALAWANWTMYVEAGLEIPDAGLVDRLDNITSNSTHTLARSHDVLLTDIGPGRLDISAVLLRRSRFARDLTARWEALSRGAISPYRSDWQTDGDPDEGPLMEAMIQLLHPRNKVPSPCARTSAPRQCHHSIYQALAGPFGANHTHGRSLWGRLLLLPPSQGLSRPPSCHEALTTPPTAADAAAGGGGGAGGGDDTLHTRMCERSRGAVAEGEEGGSGHVEQSDAVMAAQEAVAAVLQSLDGGKAQQQQTDAAALTDLSLDGQSRSVASPAPAGTVAALASTASTQLPQAPSQGECPEASKLQAALDEGSGTIIILPGEQPCHLDSPSCKNRARVWLKLS